MRICVIFNPAARGDRARRFRRQLGSMAGDCAFKATAAAGDARRLAAESVAEGYEVVAAAGGDGTVNEVVNGIGDVAGGFERARLGVIPLGTVNVFARELRLPGRLEQAWQVLLGGKERRLDLPVVDFASGGRRERRYFIQLAGAGLDARAIELVSWQWKQRTGPLAYVVAGLRALAERQPRITVRVEGASLAGELALAGNGRFYGGSLAVFPAADPADGWLDVCMVPRVNPGMLLRCAPALLWRRRLPESRVRRVRARSFEWVSDTPVAFELDGEWVGHLPAAFSIAPGKLRVAAP